MGHKKKKKKKKYKEWIETDYDDLCAFYQNVTGSSQPPEHLEFPKEMYIDRNKSPGGVVIGQSHEASGDEYIGIPQTAEGNFAIIGGCGSGKSASIAKPTISRWKGGMCVSDFKQELYNHYIKNYRDGRDRPAIKFDFNDPSGPSYDPFDFLRMDGEDNLPINVRELVNALCPDKPDVNNKFWEDTERAILEAAIYFYFKLGLSFSETMCKIVGSTVSSLCAEIEASGDTIAKAFLGEMSNFKPELLAEFDRGLRNKIMFFAVDPYISHAFRGEREGAKCFSWSDLEDYNIFICIPENRIDIYSRAINLLYTQLIQYLERRPEKYSEEGSTIEPTLILMDEVARFGKLESLSNALTTLRSKNVNFCLMLQSIAQLELHYGETTSKIILDNCQYKAILRADDANTQKYIAELIGTHLIRKESQSYHYDDFSDENGHTVTTHQEREMRVFPHELSSLKDVLVLTPDGFYRLDKIDPTSITNANSEKLPEDESPVQIVTGIVLPDTKQEHEDLHIIRAKLLSVTKKKVKHLNEKNFRNEDTVMLTFDQRKQKVDQYIPEALLQQRQKQRAERKNNEKINSRRNYILGDLVSKYFPNVAKIMPGSEEENLERFSEFENILAVLAEDIDLMNDVVERARQRTLENERNGIDV